MARILADVGHPLTRIAIISDSNDALSNEVMGSISEPSLIVISGGLGPTDDDCTRSALARLIGRPLVRDEGLAAELQARAERRGREFPKVNLRQADIPEGAKILPNSFGTAPGFLVDYKDSVLVCLPGVPSEFEGMLATYRDEILSAAGISAVRVEEVTFRIFGITESGLQEKLASIEGYPHMSIRSLPHFPEICLKISPRNGYPEFKLYLEKLRTVLSWRLFSESSEVDFFEDAIEHMHVAGATLALAESCTGGIIAHRITRIPGCSRVFQGGVVSYANEAKETLLEVSPDLIAQHGAVSEAVAASMAAGIRERLQATHGIAVTGIAGPSGGTEDKPVGTVFIGVAHPGGVEVVQHTFPGFGRERFQLLAGYAAFSVLRRLLDGDSVSG